MNDNFIHFNLLFLININIKDNTVDLSRIITLNDIYFGVQKPLSQKDVLNRSGGISHLVIGNLTSFK